MSFQAYSQDGGTQRFFYLSFRNASLKNYYNNMFTMVHQYKYTLTELENMIPWERDTYIGMVNSWVKEESDKIKQKQVEQETKMNSLISRARNKRRK